MVTTPAGVKVQLITPAEALRRAAEILKLQPAMHEPAPEALYGALCFTGARAAVRFHAFGMIRKLALGSTEAGDLSQTIKGLSNTQLAELCERAAGVTL